MAMKKTSSRVQTRTNSATASGRKATASKKTGSATKSRSGEGRVLLDAATGWVEEQSASVTVVREKGKGTARTETTSVVEFEMIRKEPKSSEKSP